MSNCTLYGKEVSTNSKILATIGYKSRINKVVLTILMNNKLCHIVPDFPMYSHNWQISYSLNSQLTCSPISSGHALSAVKWYRYTIMSTLEKGLVHNDYF